MLKKCGKKCFLGPDKSFPICAKGTCKVNDKGLYAAYVRAKQWGGSPEKYKGKSQPRLSKICHIKKLHVVQNHVWLEVVMVFKN